MKTVLTILFSIIFITNSLHSAIIDNGVKFFSPNGKNIFYISEENGNTYYNICLNNKNYRFENKFNPTFKVEWSEDSRSIFTLNHAYHEVVVQILHYFYNKDTKQGKWVVRQVYPPLNTKYEYFLRASDWIVGNKTLLIFCSYLVKTKNGDMNYYIGQFKADVETGKSFDLKKKKVNKDTYVKHCNLHNVD